MRVGNHTGCMTFEAIPTKLKHPRVPDTQAALDKSPFAYFDYGAFASDGDMDQYKTKIRQNCKGAKEAPSYNPFVAYPTAPKAATAIEQGIVQDTIDVYIDVNGTRRGTLPIRFVRKTPNSHDVCWVIVRFPGAFKTRFKSSLGRLKRKNDSVGIAFWPPHLSDKPNDDVWPCRIVMREIGFTHSGDLIFDCHWPSELDSTKTPTGLKKVKTFDSGLNKEQLLKLQQGNAQRDVAQGQSLTSLATDTFTPIRRISFLGRHREPLQRAILDRVHNKDRAAFMDVLSKVPVGVLPIVGFAGSGKTDLMATTILLAMGVGPAIVCTPTHAAASNIDARVNKLASLAYGKVKELMPVVVRGFSWKVDELRGKAHASGKDRLMQLMTTGNIHCI